MLVTTSIHTGLAVTVFNKSKYILVGRAVYILITCMSFSSGIWKLLFSQAWCFWKEYWNILVFLVDRVEYIFPLNFPFHFYSSKYNKHFPFNNSKVLVRVTKNLITALHPLQFHCDEYPWLISVQEETPLLSVCLVIPQITRQPIPPLLHPLFWSVSFPTGKCWI